MVSVRPVSAVARVLRNSLTAVSVLRRYLDLDPAYAASVTLRVLPRPIRRRLVSAAKRRSNATAAIVLAADDDKRAALATLRRAANGAKNRQLRRLVAAAAALDAPRQARELLDQLPANDPAWTHLSALVQACEGHLARAAEAARSGFRGRKVRRRLTSELRALSGQVPTGLPTDVRAEHVPGRVLHLATNSLPEVTAGYTVRTQGIVAAQRADGLDAHVSTRLGFPVAAGHIAAAVRIDVAGVPYHRLLPVRGMPRASDKLLAADIDAASRLVERLRPAVLHAHSKYTNAQVALNLRARHGLPVVYEVRGFLEETWRSRGRDPDSDAYQLARAIETECMRSADAVVTISEGMKEEIVSRGVPVERVTVVPNAVDETFLGEPPDATRLRRRHGVSPEELLVGVVSTLNAYEGVDVLIDAVAQLRRNGVPARLMIVGDGPQRNALTHHADRQDLNGHAIFTGQVPSGAVREYHSAIDVFCVPRLDTPVTRLVTPLKPLEAMATGKPVVASDLPPLREIVQPNQTGLLVTANDSTALAEALKGFATDSAQRSQLGKQARTWTAEHRTWAMASHQYRALYRRIGAHVAELAVT